MEIVECRKTCRKLHSIRTAVKNDRLRENQAQLHKE